MRKLAFLSVLPGLLLAGAAQAEGEVLLDYRDTAFTSGQAFYAQPDRRRIAALLKTASPEAARDMGETFAILGDADGTFANGSGRVYLIQSRAPAAIEPFPNGPAPVLLVTGQGEAAQLFRLPPDVQYQRLVAAADGNGDRRDEVLLEASFTNMGQTTTALDVIRLEADGTAKPVQTLRDVALDACDNPSGERTRSAATVRIGPEGFEAKPHALPCP